MAKVRAVEFSTPMKVSRGIPVRGGQRCGRIVRVKGKRVAGRVGHAPPEPTCLRIGQISSQGDLGEG